MVSANSTIVTMSMMPQVVNNDSVVNRSIISNMCNAVMLMMSGDINVVNDDNGGTCDMTSRVSDDVQCYRYHRLHECHVFVSCL
jgi:hypothetical protein